MEISPALTTFVAVAIYGVVHSILAATRLKQWARRVFGAWGERGYRLLYNLLALITFLPVLVIAMQPSPLLYQIRMPWLVLTLTLQGLALAALGVGVLQTGALSFLGIRQLFKKTPPPSRFIAGGLYRYVRHPLYTAGLLLMACFPTMTLNLLVLFTALALYVLIGIWFEERKLLVEFGEVYARYQRSTPMLIPWPRFRGRRDENR
jgi:protein-S-isoprenylcysteine O-methyltransferase Ste14